MSTQFHMTPVVIDPDFIRFGNHLAIKTSRIESIRTSWHEIEIIMESGQKHVFGLFVLGKGSEWSQQFFVDAYDAMARARRVSMHAIRGDDVS